MYLFACLFAGVGLDKCKQNSGVGCGKNAVCVKRKGTYFCKCKRGYVGDGQTCFRKKKKGRRTKLSTLFNAIRYDTIEEFNMD